MLLSLFQTNLEKLLWKLMINTITKTFVYLSISFLVLLIGVFKIIILRIGKSSVPWYMNRAIHILSTILIISSSYADIIPLNVPEEFENPEYWVYLAHLCILNIGRIVDVVLLLYFRIAEMEQPPWRYDVSLRRTEMCVTVAYTFVYEKEQDGSGNLWGAIRVLTRDKKLQWHINKKS